MTRPGVSSPPGKHINVAYADKLVLVCLQAFDSDNFRCEVLSKVQNTKCRATRNGWRDFIVTSLSYTEGTGYCEGVKFYRGTPTGYARSGREGVLHSHATKAAGKY